MTRAPELFAVALIFASSTWMGCGHSPEAHSPEAHGPEAHGPEAHGPGAHGPEAHGPEADHEPMAEGHHGGHAGEHNPENVKSHVDQVFAELDANGDHAISQEEAEGHRVAGKFDQIDANGDGAVSYDEMTAFGTKMHAGKAPPH